MEQRTSRSEIPATFRLPGEFFALDLVFRQHRADDDVAVTVDEFGRGMNRDIATQFERTL